MGRKMAFLCTALLVIVGIFGTVIVLQRIPTNTHAASSGDYPMFMGDITHSGDNTNETSINPSTAHSLALAWKFTASIGIVSSPVIVGGILYFGAWDGYEYAVNVATHQQIWKQYLGVTQQTKVCYGGHVGVSSTAAVSNNVVYVGGGDGNIYALNAQSGTVIWKQFLGAPPYYIWSSPVVYNNRVYIGLAAYCDPPGVQGKLLAFSTSNGAVAGTFDVIPNGQTGPTIWSSPVIDAATNRIFVTTGNLGTINGSQNPSAQPYGEAFVALDASTLNVVDHWQIPVSDMGGDADFGASPTLFDANGVGYIGAENKNGYYYVLNRNNLAAGAVWKYYLDGKVPASIVPEDNDATACFNNGVLYVGGGIVNGGAGTPATYGSIHAFNPTTGAQTWGFTTIGIVQSSLSCTGNGLVVDVQGSTVEVRNASDGSVLFHYTLGNRIQATPVISNGTLYVASRDGSVYAFTVNGTTPTPQPTQPPSPTATTPVPTLSSGPVSKTWYFAEGRIGKGFREYLTIDNPTSTACSVNIQYNYTPDVGTPGTKTMSNVVIAPMSRHTESVNSDLNIVDYSPTADSLASVVTMSSGSTCAGVVAERPMYFSNYHGISSGTDMLGATGPATSYYFADVPTGGSNTSFISILNPGGTATNVTATYYVNGQQVGTQNVTVNANARGTIAPSAATPTLPGHVAAIISSTAPVVVERPTYFLNGPFSISGAYDVVGAQSPANDWFFAEGYTNTGFQEYLTIANPNTTTANVTITLKSKTGATKAFPVTVGAKSQLTWNVNQNNNFVGFSPEVSSEVSSTGASIVVQRELYFHYSHSIVGGTSVQSAGGTDVVGMTGPVSKVAYSFAEGYTNPGYHEWLTLQNTTANSETIYVTLINEAGKTYSQGIAVPGNARLTVDVTQMVEQHISAPGNDSSNSISMTVQTVNNGGTFVAERPEYWNTSGTGYVTQGGTDIIGYAG